MKQFSNCPRSVTEGVEPTNKPRVSSPFKTPASVGSALHKCIEDYVISLMSGLDKRKSYLAAMATSKALGVFPEFLDIDFELVNRAIGNSRHISTEVPMVVDKTGRGRICSYSGIDERDIYAGTADAIVVGPGGDSVTIIDWKTGLDDVDPADQNDQLFALAYAYSTFSSAKAIRLIVCNPITGHFSEYETSGGKMVFNIEAFMAVDPHSESAGAHCRYCHLKGNCKSFSQYAEKTMEEINVD